MIYLLPNLLQIFSKVPDDPFLWLLLLLLLLLLPISSRGAKSVRRTASTNPTSYVRAVPFRYLLHCPPPA